MIIHICGMPGVGKLTIAKHLKNIMSARLIDNHLFVDLAQGKLRNPDVLSEILSKYTPAHYPQHPNAFTLDNTNLDAVTSAQIIADHCKKCPRLKEPEEIKF